MSKYIDCISLSTGSLSLCSISIVGDEDTGIYSSGTNIINIVSGGTSIIQSSPTGVVIVGSVQFSSFGSGVIHSSTVGSLASSLIVNSDISSSAAIANSKLAGNPSSTNTASTIVLRDASGNSAHGTLTSSAIVVGGITYPTATVSNGSYLLTSTSNILSFTSSSPYQSIYGTRGYATSGGYTYTSSGTAGTFTQCSANGNLGNANSGFTQTATGLTVLTAGTYLVVVQISCRTGVWAPTLSVAIARNTTTSTYYASLGGVGITGLAAFDMSACYSDIITCSVNDTLSIYMTSTTASTSVTVRTWNITANRL